MPVTPFYILANNVESTNLVPGSLNNIAARVTFAVPPGEGDQFPTPDGLRVAIVTMWDRAAVGDNPKADSSREIAFLIAKTGDNLTIQRPNPVAHGPGIVAVCCLWTELHVSQIQDAINAVENCPVLITSAQDNFPNAVNLGSIGAGILKQSVSSDVATVGIAARNTDYYGPGSPTPSMLDRLIANPVDLTDATTINTDASQSCAFHVEIYMDRILGAPVNPLPGQRCYWSWKNLAGAPVFLTFNDIFNMGLFSPDSTRHGGTGHLEAIYDVTVDQWRATAYFPDV